MSVTIDQELVETNLLGFSTLGEVLVHAQQDDRMVVNLLINGQVPDLSEMSELRGTPLEGRIIFIETARPDEMALDVLDDVQQQLVEAEEWKSQAAELLQQNQLSAAMDKLGFYFLTWQTAHESVVKTSQLLRLDLETLTVESQSIAEILSEFASLLRQTNQTLIDRDFVSLTDQLLYETSHTCERWIAVLDAIRSLANASAVI